MRPGVGEVQKCIASGVSVVMVLWVVSFVMMMMMAAWVRGDMRLNFKGPGRVGSRHRLQQLFSTPRWYTYNLTPQQENGRARVNQAASTIALLLMKSIGYLPCMVKWKGCRFLRS